MNIKIVQMKQFKMRKNSLNENNSSKEKKIVQMNKKIVQMNKKIVQMKQINKQKNVLHYRKLWKNIKIV